MKTWPDVQNTGVRDFPGSPGVKTPHFPTQRAWLRSLVGGDPTCHVEWPKSIGLTEKFILNKFKNKENPGVTPETFGKT